MHPLPIDRFETEWAWTLGAVRQCRHRTGDRQHVQDGDVGAIAARDRDRPAEGMARELREIDRTENVLDVDHDHLQSGCLRRPSHERTL